MNISKILKEVATGENLGFYHGPKGYQNLQDQKKDKPFPVCYQDFARSRGVKTKQGFSGPEFIVELLIADKADLSWDMDKHEEVIDRMDDLSHNYINRLLKHPGVTDVISYDTVEVINVFDTNLTGIIMNVTFRVRDTRSNCVS